MDTSKNNSDSLQALLGQRETGKLYIQKKNVDRDVCTTYAVI